MESKDLVVINGQLCSKDVAMLIIEKVYLPFLWWWLKR